VDEGCQGAAFGKVTFQHKDSYHLNPKRQIVEYEWLFQTVAAPTNATFEAVPWSSLALDTYYTAHPTNPATKIYAFRTASRDMAPVWQYLNTGTYHAALRVKDNSVDADNNPAPKFNIYSIKNIVVNPQPALAPTANAHGPYEVIEGDGLPLAGEIGDPNLLCRADALTPKWYIPTATARPAIGLTGTAPWLGVLDSIPQRNTPVEIKLEVTDSTGKTATSTTTVKIWDRDFHPCFDLTPSPEVGCNGTVQVDASCTTHPHTGTGFKTFEWQCDNSKAYDAVGFTFTAQSIGKTANCTYKIPGTYYLTLRVTDDYDTVMYTQQQVVMSSSSSPQANAGPAYTLDTWQDQYWAGEDSRQGGFFTLNGSGSVDPDAACGDAIVRWEWDLNEDGIADDLDGDGIPPAQDPDDVVAQPKVTWANLYKLFQAKGWGRERYIANPATGLLNVRVGLKVTDKFGKTGTASSSLTIYHSGPYGVFTANPNPAACGDSAPPVTLDASRSWHGHPTRLITQYAWVFDMPEAVAGADPALILAKFNERVDTQGVSVQHVYPEFGTYHPVLRVTDAQGKTALAFGTPVVVSQGNAAPLVDIGGPYEWSVGGLLQLDARGTIDPNEACGDAAVTFEWDLDGDGQYGEPSAVEGKAGEPVGEAPILQWAQVSHWIPAASWPAAPPTWEPRWTVGLRVTDANGASSTATTEIPIYALTPVAVADWTPKPVVPIDPASGKALVKLDGSWSSTSDPSRTIIQWSWKLGAGTQTTTGEKAQLLVDLGADRAIWEVPGGRVTRDISLRVTDSGNSTADDLITVTFGILASTPAVIQFADDQLAIQVLDPLKVSASATPAAGTTIDYVGWDMNGDGVDERTWVRGVNGQDPTVALKLNLTWAQLLQLYPALTSLGDHEIRLTVKDSLGTPSQDSVKLTVLEKALRAVIRYEPSEGGCSTLFTFDGSGSESLIGSEIVKYTWNYGDGTPSGSTASVVHVFNRFATNTVTLTVEDLADPPHSATTSVSISTTDGNIPPVVKPNGPYFIDADVFSQDANARLTLTGAGTTDPDSGCGDAPAVYRWDLDGVLDAEGHRTWEIETTTVTATVSWAQVLLWKLPQGDLNHRIYLEVEDEQGGTSTAWTTLLIGSGRPVAMFRASPEIAMCGEPVSFDATQSYHPMAPLKTITSYLWDFDYVAANGFVASPLHVNEVQFRQTLPRVGQVKVALRVADADGKSSLFVLPIDVSGDNKAPIARAKPVVAAVGEGVLLDATLSSDPNEGCGDAIVSYQWDLGNDGGGEPWDFSTSTPTLQLTKEQVAAFNFPITDPFTRLPVTLGKLRVQDVGGLHHEANVEIRYYQVTPVAKAVVQPAIAGCKVEMVFDGSASYHNHPERSIKRYIWDFDATKNTDNGDWDGDGQDTAWDDNDGEGVQYRYSQYRVKKVYDARLIVWDNVTKSLAKKDSKPIEGNPPTLAFENQKPIANPGGPYLTTVASDNSIPVNLDGTASSDPNVPCDSLVTYWWDTDDDGCFGEEDVLNVVTAGKPQCGTAATAGSVLCGAKDCTDATKSGSNPNWRVGQSYVVALKVKDSYGLWSDEAETTITIAEYVPPTVQIVKPNGGEVFGKSRNVELKVSHPKSQQARLKVWVNSVLLTAAAGQLQATSPTPVSVNIPFDTTAFESKTEFYRVKVVAELASDASIFSTVLSAGPFTIDNLGPTITVTPPDKTGANGYQQTDSLGALVDVQVDVDDQDSLPVVTYKLNNTAVASFPRRLPLGLNKLEVTAKDWLLPTPNSSTLTRFIEVIDTQQPTLFPGPNVVMEADGANGRTQVDLRPSASDICDSAVATKITSNAPPDGFPVGTTPVQFSVTDAKGNTASAEITVTIEDHKPPYFSQIPDDFSVEQSAPEGAPSSVLVEQGLVPEPIYADLGYATADLSCGLFVTLEDADGHDVPPPVGGYPCLPPECLMPKAIGVGVCPEWLPPGTFFPVGITPLTYTVTDPGGQSSSIEVLVTVIGAAPSVTVISRPDSSKWLNCAVDSCTVKFSVANGDPAKPVVVQPLPAGQQQPLPDANGVYTVTYAADGVYLVRVSVWDKAGIEYMFQVPRFNIDTSPPTLQISDFQQAGVVLDDPDTWPLFFRGEEAAPRFTARDELSGLSRVQVTAAPGLEAGGAVVILDRVQPQPLPGTPPTGVRFLGNLACSDQLGLCQGGKLFLGGMKTGEQQLVVEAWDGNDNHGTTAFPYRLISLAEALVIVRGRIADYLAAEPGAGAVTLLTQMDGFLATGQKSLARGYLGGALVSVYDSVTLMLGAALKLVAPADLVAQLKQDAQLLARGCYAETYLYWKLNAVGTAEEQTAYIALMQAWEFIWEDGIYDAAVLKVSNAYFYARNGKVPFRATDIPLSIDVIHRIMAELSEYAQYRELPAVEEVDELIVDMDSRVLWRFENLQNPGWLPAEEFMDLLLDLQDMANKMFMAQSKGCWVRNWQWGFAQAIRVVIDVAKADAEGHIPPGHAQYCKIQEAQVQYDLGMGYLDNREPDLMLDLYANWSKGIRCLMLEIYHHAGYQPAFPVENWGCTLEGCTPQGQN
jgi:PKD repeat protein